MHHVDGVVPIESPPYSVEGFFTGLSAGERTELISNGLFEMAQVHNLETSTLGLEWLIPNGVTPGSQHLLRLWKEFGESELHGRSHPFLEEAWSIIERELPSDSAVGLCWGDPRPGNIIWQGSRVACLTDFEAACIGPPEFDLGWWLMFDRTMHELAGIDRLTGDPSRTEQRDMYFRHAGRDPIDTAPHELFAAARYCVIVVRVMNRLDQRGLLPTDSTVWRDNPATECLKMILDGR
jgi:aminoglycoside phosphotransferase (APT) family kinase protein